MGKSKGGSRIGKSFGFAQVYAEVVLDGSRESWLGHIGLNQNHVAIFSVEMRVIYRKNLPRELSGSTTIRHKVGSMQ